MYINSKEVYKILTCLEPKIAAILFLMLALLQVEATVDLLPWFV